MDEIRDEADLQKRLRTISQEHRQLAEELLKSGKRLRALGYWKGKHTPQDLPDPRNMQDAAWSTEDKNLVLAYLERGTKLTAYCGHSYCRFDCGENNMGAHDLTDGSYCWPEGLAHYLQHHSVRLPEEFVRHVKMNVATVFPDKSDITVHLLWFLAADYSWWKTSESRLNPVQ